MLCNKYLRFRPAGLWVLFHAVLLAAAFLNGPFKINADLFDILPPSSAVLSARNADNAFTAKTSRSIYILAGNTDFDSAKMAAERLFRQFSTDKAFEKLSLYAGPSAMGELSRFIFENRFMLLDEETAGLLETGGALRVADEAAASVYGAFNLTSLSGLVSDPFLLSERILRSFLSSGLADAVSVSPKDGVLASEYGGRWYVLLQGGLTAEAAAVNVSSGVIDALYSACDGLERDMPGTDFVFSGVPFHSYESSSNAQREISVITSLSIVLIILLFLYLFRQPLPVFVAVAAVSVSAGAAVCAVQAAFGQIHVLTFVFGTTLIGTGLDYTIHYFINWKGNRRLLCGKDIKSHIFKGISLGFLSTTVCYVFLLPAPFPILRQVSVFLLAGLSSAYLSAVFLYGSIPLPSDRKRRLPSPRLFARAGKSRAAIFFKSAKNRAGILACLFAAAAALLYLNRGNIRIDNDLRSLYTMSEKLMRSEIIASKILNHGSAGWYFIVSGDSPEDVLKNEETLRRRLDSEIRAGSIGTYIAVSRFVPSPYRQKRNYEAAGKLLPYVPAQYARLGFPDTAGAYESDYVSSAGKYVYLDDAPSYVRESVSGLWIGEIDGRWYSVVLPLHPKDDNVFRLLADDDPNVFFVDKVQDITAELDSLTSVMLKLLAGAFAAILLILCIWYKVRIVLRISIVPVFIGMATLAVLAVCGIPIGFFSASGLILVFGLGLDYIIYTIEAEHDRSGITDAAIALSYLTTVLSFGALVFTAFVPVHVFGLTVLSGLSAAYIASLLMKRSFSSDSQ